MFGNPLLFCPFAVGPQVVASDGTSFKSCSYQLTGDFRLFKGTADAIEGHEKHHTYDKGHRY